MTSTFIALLLASGSLAGSGWSDVQALSAGARIRVELAADRIEGTLLGASADRVTLRAGRRDVTLDRASVERVSHARGRSTRVRNAVIGAAMGAAVGGAWYLSKCAEQCLAEGAAAYTAPLFWSGAIIGGLSSHQQWTVVYGRVKPGARVRLTLDTGRFEAIVAAISADALTARIGQRAYAIRRDSVRRMDVRQPGSNRGRNVKRGFLIGVIGGAGLSALTCSGCNSFGVALAVPKFALIGAIAGATTSGAKWERIY
jgi:hypothetical protein